MAEVLEIAKKTIDTSEMKKFLRSLAERIPKAMRGVDRQEYIGLRLLKELSDDKIVELQDFYNTFLQAMRDKAASDIDLGGWGAKGHVWLRVHGAKKPVEELGKFTNVEMDILIQSLLMENQKKALYKNRNLDFSYNFTGRLGDSQRYRADAYFETNCLALNMRAINTKIFPYETY